MEVRIGSGGLSTGRALICIAARTTMSDNDSDQRQWRYILVRLDASSGWYPLIYLCRPGEEGLCFLRKESCVLHGAFLAVASGLCCRVKPNRRAGISSPVSSARVQGQWCICKGESCPVWPAQVWFSHSGYRVWDAFAWHLGGHIRFASITTNRPS